jgi:hypothetical protein
LAQTPINPEEKWFMSENGQSCCLIEQPASSLVAEEDISLDQGLVLETLNLHATALDKALRRILAVEAEVTELRSNPTAPTTTAQAVTTPIGAGFFPSRFEAVHLA